MANISIAENIGGLEDKIDYQFQAKIETTKESQNPSWQIVNAPIQEAQQGYIAYNSNENNEQLEDDLAMIYSEAKIAGNYQNTKTPSTNTLNLILLLFVVILGALIIGILITKFLKKSS